ncbi:MAG: choice-of-anchor tandem repeat GloVer-containing protein [Candidatus Cybelea sp.]
MRTLIRAALSVSTAALFVACGGSQSQSGRDLARNDGMLYGTTTHGGSAGLGVVFSVSTSGREQVLHSFGGGPDGADPLADLVNVNNTLYGTTYGGGFKSGCRGSGCGTIFALTP